MCLYTYILFCIWNTDLYTHIFYYAVLKYIFISMIGTELRNKMLESMES